MPGVVEKQQTAREIFREMRATTHSYAKNFAMIGMVFSAVECTIESVLSKQKIQPHSAQSPAIFLFVLFSTHMCRIVASATGKMARMRVV